MEDPSDKYRPEKTEEEFRNFTEDGEYYGRVRETYRLMHTNQTYDFVKGRVSIICWLNCMRIILLYFGWVEEAYLLMHTNQTYDFVKGRVSSISYESNSVVSWADKGDICCIMGG